jgi:hypothetical protein
VTALAQGLPTVPFLGTSPAMLFPQPVHAVGLERPVLSAATAHLGPLATTSLGNVTVHLASLGLAASRVGVPLNFHPMERVSWGYF